jgi:hypothetical protein
VARFRMSDGHEVEVVSVGRLAAHDFVWVNHPEYGHIMLHRQHLTWEVPPPLPPEPPVGSVVLDANGRVWQCRAGRPGNANAWQSLTGGQEKWEYIATLTPVLLVPDPLTLPPDRQREMAEALWAAANAAEMKP